MGVIIKWKVPDTDQVSYDTAYIYRNSSDDSSTATEVGNQAIADNSYFDPDGSVSDYYWIRFYDSGEGDWSSYSESLSVGSGSVKKFVGFCTPDDVRMISNISSTSTDANYLSDSQIYDVIQFAQSTLITELSSKIREERVTSIDSNARQNIIDSSNTTYYVQRSYKWFIADRNGDGEIDENDVIVWEYDSSADTKTKVTVSSVDAETGKIILSSAPSTGNTVTITYRYTDIDMFTPDPHLKTTCTYLVAALAHQKLEATDFDRLTLGKMTVSKRNKTFDYFHKSYKEYLHQLKGRMTRKARDRKSITVYP